MNKLVYIGIQNYNNFTEQFKLNFYLIVKTKVQQKTLKINLFF